jgi:hypothetical protein
MTFNEFIRSIPHGSPADFRSRKIEIIDDSSSSGGRPQFAAAPDIAPILMKSLRIGPICGKGHGMWV